MNLLCRYHQAPPAAYEVMKVKKLIVWLSPLLVNTPILPPPASLSRPSINICISGLLPNFHPHRLQGKWIAFHGSLCLSGFEYRCSDTEVRCFRRLSRICLCLSFSCYRHLGKTVHPLNIILPPIGVFGGSRRTWKILQFARLLTLYLFT